MSLISSNWPSQRRLSVWYALTLGVLLLNGLVTYWNVRTISKGADQIARTRQLSKSLDDVLLDLRTAESGQRGFLLTGDEAYLASYDRTTATIDAAMGRLKALTAVDPVDRSRDDVEEVERLARAKLAELAETIDLQRGREGEAALAVVKSRRGRSLMNEIVDRITKLESEELGARRRLKEEQAEAISQTILTFGLATGLAVGLLAVIRNLNLRSRRELALRAEWLATTLRSIGDAVVAADADGRVTLMNSVAAELTGWAASDAIGKDLDEILPVHDEATRSPIPNPARRVLETGRAQGLAEPTILLAKDGVERPIDDSAAPIRDDQNTVQGVVMVFRDVAQRRLDEQERERLNQELRDNDARKDEFLAMLAHELRNPLAAIGNALMVAKKADAGRESIDWALDLVGRQAAHLTRLIEDLLDVSRISRGKIEMRLERVEASPLLDNAVESVRPLIDKRRHALAVVLDRGALWLDADPTRLGQVVVNLLSNAAKYSEDCGRIELSGVRDGGDVVIAVKDDGFGLAPEKLPRMFELFAQDDRASARSEGGLGIGLTIVKKLVELHGGTITAESEGPGRGCTFRVRLPAASPTAANAPAPST